MIEFKNLTLEDKPTIDRYFREVQPRNSECTFTNMFIWRDCYEVQWAIVDGLLIVKPGQMDESWILQPWWRRQRPEKSGAKNNRKELIE